jgi:hypothetical protein
MSNEEIKGLIEKILDEKKKEIIRKIDSLKKNITGQLEDLKSLNDFSNVDIPDNIFEKKNSGQEGLMDILYQSIKKISQSDNQKSLIDSILDGIKDFCNRSALFLIKDDKFIGWNGIGFSNKGGDIKNEDIKKVFFSLSASTIFKYVIEKKKVYLGKPLSQPDDHLIYNRLGGQYPDKICVVPFYVKGKPQAVIYADSMNNIDLHEKEIEIISIVGEMSLDLLPLKQKIYARVQTKEYDEEEEATFVSERTDQIHIHEETAHSVIDNDPERKARVIINDIILYNKEIVENGIKNRNLYDVLEDTILQAREEFLRKFSNIATFERNLVNILAKGDKAVLRGYKFETL